MSVADCHLYELVSNARTALEALRDYTEPDEAPDRWRYDEVSGRDYLAGSTASVFKMVAEAFLAGLDGAMTTVGRMASEAELEDMLGE